MLLRALQANAKSINLSCKKLKKVPKIIGKIQTVQQVDLKGNQLSVLPEELGNLVQVNTISQSIMAHQDMMSCAVMTIGPRDWTVSVTPSDSGTQPSATVRNHRSTVTRLYGYDSHES